MHNNYYVFIYKSFQYRLITFTLNVNCLCMFHLFHRVFRFHCSSFLVLLIFFFTSFESITMYRFSLQIISRCPMLCVFDSTECVCVCVSSLTFVELAHGTRLILLCANVYYNLQLYWSNIHTAIPNHMQRQTSNQSCYGIWCIHLCQVNKQWIVASEWCFSVCISRLNKTVDTQRLSVISTSLYIVTILFVSSLKVYFCFACFIESIENSCCCYFSFFFTIVIVVIVIKIDSFPTKKRARFDFA